MDCTNLKERFGRRYRVEYEESYYAEHGDGARVEDPWLMIVPCRYGHVFPWGGSTLAASVDGYPKVAGRLRRLRCCRVVQDGDFGELTATFDVAEFPKVAKVMRPRRRRQISQQERERLRHIGFRVGSESHYERQFTARTGIPKAQHDPNPVPQSARPIPNP